MSATPRQIGPIVDVVVAKALRREGVQVLTKSRIQAYRACPRYHELRYELGYKPVDEGEDLTFGRAWHTGQDAWWLAAKRGLDPDARLTAALAAIEEEDRQKPEEHRLDPFARARATALLAGYTVRWGSQDLEVVEVEVEFRCPLVNPATAAQSRTWVQGGKLDKVVRDREGRAFLVEHKSTSENITPASDYWKRLRMEAQISTYYEGADALGFDLWGCLYDVVQKPQHKPLKATPEENRKYTKDGLLYANQRDVDETPGEYLARIGEAIAENPDRYFQRGDVVRLERDLIEHRRDTWLTARMIRESQLAESWPRNPGACTRWGRTCEFWPVCTGEADLSDETRYRISESIHPELGTKEVSDASNETATK